MLINLSKFAAVAIALILLFTFIETVLWWHTWHRQSQKGSPQQETWETALIFLTGISDYRQNQLELEQIHFLQRLNQQFMFDVVVAEPFPWDQFTANKLNQWDLWRYFQLKRLPLWVMSLHNFWQTMLLMMLPNVYSRGIAHCLLNRIGFPKSSESQLILICGSTGTGMALAAIPDLKQSLSSEVVIISYGGVFGLSPGLQQVDQFFHLVGSRDIWAKFSQKLLLETHFNSDWFTQAQQDNRLWIGISGDHQHLDYLSECSSPADSQTYQDLTLNVIFNLPLKRFTKRQN